MVRSNGQGLICGAVKRSSNKNDGQNFLTPVAAVTRPPLAVCKGVVGRPGSQVVWTPDPSGHARKGLGNN